jgi:HEPN domain-containing protein
MRQDGFGYSYMDGQIIRVDSEYLHDEVVKPALKLLNGPGFQGAQEEFLRAHRHYRAGEYPQSITEAAKSFESVLKAVCDQKKWRYEKGARASDLLKRIRQEGLWPEFLDASFDQLLATLNSGLPKVRNEQGAHGQGASIRKIPNYLAAYALHLAAAKIRLIVEAAQS